MKRPKQIELTPYSYKVIEDDKLGEVAGLVGTALTDTEQILIGTKLGFNVERATLLHEILHVIFTMGVSKKLGVDSDTEEQIVAGMETHLLNFIRNNPELIEWMSELGK